MYRTYLKKVEGSLSSGFILIFAWVCIYPHLLWIFTDNFAGTLWKGFDLGWNHYMLPILPGGNYGHNIHETTSHAFITIQIADQFSDPAVADSKYKLPITVDANPDYKISTVPWVWPAHGAYHTRPVKPRLQHHVSHGHAWSNPAEMYSKDHPVHAGEYYFPNSRYITQCNANFDLEQLFSNENEMDLAPNADDIYNVFNKRPDLVYRYRSGQIHQKAQDEAWPDYNTKHVSDLIYPFTWPMVFSNHIRTKQEMEGTRMHMLYTPSYEPLLVRSNRVGRGKQVFTQFNNLNKHYEAMNESLYYSDSTAMNNARYGGGRTEFVLYRDYLVYGMDMNNVINKRIELSALSRTPYSTLSRCLFGSDANYYWNTETNTKEEAEGTNIIDLKALVMKKLNTLSNIDKWSQVTRWYTTILLVMTTGKIFFSSRRNPANLEWLCGNSALQLQSTCLVFWILLRYAIIRIKFGDVCFDDGYLIGSSAPIGDLIRTVLPGFSCTWYLSGRRQAHELCAVLTCIATWMINWKGSKVDWARRTAHIGYGGYKFGCYFFLVFTMYFNSIVAAQVAIMAFNGAKDQSTFGMKSGFPIIDWFLTAGNVAIEWGEYFDFAVYMLIIYHTVDITAGYVTNKHGDILKFRTEDKLDCIRPFFIMMMVFGLGQHRLFFIEGAPYDFWKHTLNQPWNSAWYFNTILFKMRCWKIFVLVKFLQQCENFMERNNRIIYRLMRFFITFIFITFYLGNAYFWTSCTQSVARQPWVDSHFYIGLPVFDVYSQDMKMMYNEWWDTWKNTIQAKYCCDNQIDRDEFGEPNGTTYHGDMVCRLGDPDMTLPYGDGNHVREYNREWQGWYLDVGSNYHNLHIFSEGTSWDENPDPNGQNGPEYGTGTNTIRSKYCPNYNAITWDVFWHFRYNTMDMVLWYNTVNRMVHHRGAEYASMGHHEHLTFTVPNGDMVLVHYQQFLLHNYIFPTLSCQGWPNRQCDASNFIMGWTRQKGGQRYGWGWGSKIPSASIMLLQELYGENGSRLQHDHRTLVSKIGSDVQMADWSNQVMLDEVEYEHNQWSFNRTLDDGNENPNAKHWPSLYFEHVPVTIWYSMMQIISTAGLGDMAPTTALEKLIYICTMILTVGVVEIGLFNTIDGFIKSEVNEKTSYVRSAVAAFFAYCGAENTHHIDRSQSSLWLHWHLWHGLMPLAPENADLNILPAPILQEIYYSVFMSVLKQNKSKVFSKMNNNQLKYMSRGMTYGITHKGDAIINSIETQSFVLIIFNGRFKVMDHNDNELARLMGGEVYYETECFLGLSPPGRIVAASTHVEYFRIDKKWYNNVLQSYPNLYARLVHTLVEGGKRHIERDTDSTYIELEPKIEALEGLESPVCAQNLISLPKVSDILTYKAHAVQAKLHRDTRFNLKDIDSATKTLVNMANVMMARQALATAHAYDRTEKRNVLRTVEEEENRELQIAGKRDIHLGILNDWMATGVADKDRNMRKSVTRQSMQVNPGESELGDLRSALQYNTLTQGTSQTSMVSIESFPELPEKIFSQEDTTLDAMRAEQREKGERSRSMFVLFYGVFTTFAFFLILVECGFYNKTKGGRPVMFYLVRYLVDAIIWTNWFYIEYPNLKENRRVSGFSDDADNWINVAFQTFEIHTSILIAMVPWEFLYVFSGGFGNFATWFFYCRLLGKFHHLQNCARMHFEKKAHKLYASPWVYLIQWVITLVGCIQFTACLSYWWPCGSAPVHEDFESTCMPGSWPWMLFEEGTTVLSVPDTDPVDGVLGSWWGDLNMNRRWMVTYYWKMKIYSAFNDGGIIPQRTAGKVFVIIELLLSLLFLPIVCAAITAAFTLNTKSMLIADFEAHWRGIKLKLKHLRCKKLVKNCKDLMFAKTHNLSIPGLFDPEDNLFPIDRVICKGLSVERIIHFIPAFQKLPQGIKTQLGIAANHYNYPAEQVVISSNESVARCFTIRCGAVAVYDADDNLLGFLEAGQSFNYLEFFAQTANRHTFKTHTSCEIIDWRYADVARVFESYEPWNFLTDITGDAQRAIAKTVITPKVATQTDDRVAAGIVENQGMIDFAKQFWKIYVAVQNIRISLLIALTCYTFAFYHHHSWAVKTIQILDLFAYIDIFVQLFRKRFNNVTGMQCYSTVDNMIAYAKSGLIFDLVACLPFEKFLGGADHPAILLRLLQFRQTWRYFGYLKYAAPDFYFVFWIQFQLILNCVYICMIWTMSQLEAQGQDDDDVVTIPLNGDLGNSNARFIKGSMFATAFQKNIDYHNNVGNKTLGEQIMDYEINYFEGTDFTNVNSAHSTCSGLSSAWQNMVNCQNIHDIAAFNFYFMADCMNAVGLGFVYPVSLQERLTEFFFQMTGWILTVTLVAEFNTLSTQNDTVRIKFEEKYAGLTQFLADVCKGRVPDILIQELRVSFEKTYFNQTGQFDARAIFKGLPTCLVRDVATELYGEQLDCALGGGFTDPRDIRHLSPYIELLSTLAETYVVRADSLVSHCYFVEEGEYEERNTNGEIVERLGQGCHFMPNKKAKTSLYCRESGKLICLPLERMKGVDLAQNALIEEQSGRVARHFKCSLAMSLCGIFVWWLLCHDAIYGESYLNTQMDNIAFTQTCRFGLKNYRYLKPMFYWRWWSKTGLRIIDWAKVFHRPCIVYHWTISEIMTWADWILGCYVFGGITLYKVLYGMTGLNNEEFFLIICVFPVPYEFLAFRSIMWWYVFERYVYNERTLKDMSKNVGTIRWIRIIIHVVTITLLFACVQTGVLCPYMDASDPETTVLLDANYPIRAQMVEEDSTGENLVYPHKYYQNHGHKICNYQTTMLKDFNLFRRNVSHIWNPRGQYIGDSDEEFGWWVSYKKNSKGFYWYGFEKNLEQKRYFVSLTKWWPFKHIPFLGGHTGNGPRYGEEWYRFQRVTEESAIACQNATGASEPVYTFCEEVFSERMLNQVIIDMPGDHWFFIDSFYAVFDIISDCGTGNIRARNRYEFMQAAFQAIVGKILMGQVLAFSGSVRQIAQENMQNEYLIMRNRIEKMLARVKAEEFAVRYILGYLDANFSRSSHVDLHELLDAKTVAPAIKKQFFFNLYGIDISRCALFEGVASSFLREVCSEAAAIENYFAGHCIQNMNCPLESWFFVLSGTIVQGDHKALIPGEVAFAEAAFAGTKLASHHLVAFTRTEIVRINIKKFNELLDHYPIDKQHFETNCKQFFAQREKRGTDTKLTMSID